MAEIAVTRALTLPDGRQLGYAEYGDAGGRPALYFHGHPGSRIEGQFGHEAALSAGVRIIAVDRPGYGRSDFQRGRTILDWPTDIAAAAAHLGIERFAVFGGSGGGPYALACAYALPQCVTRAGVVSGVGPFEVRGATAGMRWRNRVGFQAGARIPGVARFAMWSMARQMERQPEKMVDALANAMSPVDGEIVRRPTVRAILEADLREAFRQGARGAARDMVLLGRPWGFSVAGIRCPVELWQGEADTLVPPAMGRYLATSIPGCHARFLPGEGHLLVIDHMPEIVESFVSVPRSQPIDRQQ